MEEFQNSPAHITLSQYINSLKQRLIIIESKYKSAEIPEVVNSIRKSMSNLEAILSIPNPTLDDVDQFERTLSIVQLAIEQAEARVANQKKRSHCNIM